jgi:SAM-dependent methyltransferase
MDLSAGSTDRNALAGVVRFCQPGRCCGGPYTALSINKIFDKGATLRVNGRLVAGAGLVMTSMFSLWSNGIAAERWFWKNWIETHGSEWPEDFKNRLTPSGTLDSTIAKIIRDTCPPGKVNILDVGAGPLTIVGSQLNGYNVNVIATDPLAPVYDALLQEAGITPLVRTQFAPAEGLSAFFDHSQFDVVHCRNALDHSADPMAAIIEMLRVVKVGRTVILRHFRNEAETENYGGFHQHNFDAKDGKFCIWNKQNHLVVDDNLPISTNLRTLCEGRSLETYITKNEEFADRDDVKRVNSAMVHLWNEVILFFLHNSQVYTPPALTQSSRLKSQIKRLLSRTPGLYFFATRPRDS